MHELHHIPPPNYLDMSFQEITEDILGRFRSAGSRFRTAALFLGLLFGVGLVAMAIRIASGGLDEENRSDWGYHAGTVAYIIITAQSAVLVSVALRMVKSHWRRPLSRVSELFAAVGLLNFLLYLPLIWVLPVTDDRRSLWFEWPGHSAHLWDTISMGLLVVNGLALLYFAALPDIATLRDQLGSEKNRLYSRLSLNWQGTKKQWKVLNMGVAILGGFYFLFLIFVHMMISVDFSMSLIPGWKDAIYPTYHALMGLQGGVAILVVTMFVLKKTGASGEYISVEHFWALSKHLLALSLLWFYFWWSGFYTYWYGRTPAEQSVLQLLMFETYRTPFLLSFVFSMALPFLTLVWNIVRKTIVGPTIAACFVLIGTMFSMIRIYVPAFSIEDPSGHALHGLPAAQVPVMSDVLIAVGSIAGSVLVFMLAARILPITSIWEIKEGKMLQRIKPLLKTHVRIVGKPE